MPKIELSLVIDAPIEAVFAVARNVEKFPQFMDDLKSLTVLERNDDDTRTVTEWVGLLREFKMTIKWTQEDRWSTEQFRDDFTLIKGDMDKMDGFWQFTSEAGGTRFDSFLDYEYDVPLIGAMVKSLIKKKLTENLQATMTAIKGESERLQK
ncbi:MAG: SRPBCC family protein [Chthonomonadaceae bacterium]|nr:SRPBCC family protein [Chthonomonadaceae bacterium]